MWNEWYWHDTGRRTLFWKWSQKETFLETVRRQNSIAALCLCSWWNLLRREYSREPPFVNHSDVSNKVHSQAPIQTVYSIYKDAKRKFCSVSVNIGAYCYMLLVCWQPVFLLRSPGRAFSHRERKQWCWPCREEGETGWYGLVGRRRDEKKPSADSFYVRQPCNGVPDWSICARWQIFDKRVNFTQSSTKTSDASHAMARIIPIIKTRSSRRSFINCWKSVL